MPDDDRHLLPQRAGVPGAAGSAPFVSSGEIRSAPGRPGLAMLLARAGTVIAVALTGPGRAELAEQAKRAATAGADVLELRLDLLDDVRRALASPSAGGEDNRAAHERGDLDPDTLSAVIGEVVLATMTCVDAVTRVAAGLPQVLTLRTAAEGGEVPLTDQTYADLLLTLVDHLADHGRGGVAVGNGGPVVAVDVELERGCLPQVVAAAHRANLDVVASFHDFSGTPDEESMVHRLVRMEELGADVAKVAVMPHDAVDVARLLAATARAHETARIPLVTMSMGELGAVTRLAGGVFGSALTFAVAADRDGRGAQSAPGQLGIDEVRTGLELLAPPHRR